MVRWRCPLLLALLLLLPDSIAGKPDDDEGEENSDDEGVENEVDNGDDADGASGESSDVEVRRRLSSALRPTPKMIPVTRTMIKRPLECYVCAYKIDSQIKSCLDPSKHRVHTMICHSMEEKCFTNVMTKNSRLEEVVRGCRAGCTTSPDTTCCELNRCNNQVFAMPLMSPRALTANKTTKAIPTTVLFFVTILLVLQTVVKVAFV